MRPRESGFHPAAIPALTAGISAAIRSVRFGERFRPNTENGKSMTSSRVLPGRRHTEIEMPFNPTPRVYEPAVSDFPKIIVSIDAEFVWRVL